MKNKVVINIGGGMWLWLVLIFVALKLTNVIAWPWLWVISPLWLPITAVLLFFLVLAVIAGLTLLINVLIWIYRKP